MKHSSLVAIFATSVLLIAAGAMAQTGGNPNAQPSAQPPASVPVADQANPQATAATSNADAKLAAIRERALATPEKEKKDTEAKLDATKSSVDKEAASKGDNTVADRLSKEFGMTSDALMAEKAQYKTGWGDLMIAHSLLANSGNNVTLDQLFQMRNTDGMGWGQIAHGLGLKLGSVVSAVKSEGSVATGKSKGDGKVATMHAGGESGTHSEASTHSHGGAGAGAGGGAGAGASSTHGHSGK